MNYSAARNLFQEAQELVDHKEYLEALNILVKISSAFLYYKNPPFRKREITHLAEICCRILKQKNPRHKEAQVGYGVILRNEGKLSESIEVFDDVLAHEIHREALLEKACTYELMGDNPGALNLLLMGLKAFPFEKMILNNLATLYEAQEDWNLALNYYNLAIEVDQEGGVSHYNKGRLLFSLEQYELAMHHFEMALGLYDAKDFRVIDVHIFLADTYFQVKRYQEAEKLYLNIIDLFPRRGEGYQSISDFYYKIAKKSDALNYINKAIELSFPEMDCYYKKAYYLKDLNQSSEALSTLHEALNYFPNEVKLFDLMAEIYISQGSYLPATRVLHQRNDIEADEETFYLLAESYFNLDQYSDALVWINRFIQIERDYAEAYILRAKINSVTGYYHLALQDLYDAFDLDQEDLYLQEGDLYYFDRLGEIEEYQQFLRKVKG